MSEVSDVLEHNGTGSCCVNSCDLCLYLECAGFVLFVMTLKAGLYQTQFGMVSEVVTGLIVMALPPPLSVISLSLSLSLSHSISLLSVWMDSHHAVHAWLPGVPHNAEHI